MDIRTPADLGVLIRNTRLERGATQAAVAAAAGISRDSLIRIERGHPRVELANALAVLAALDVALTSTSAVGRPDAAGSSDDLLDSVIDSLRGVADDR